MGIYTQRGYTLEDAKNACISEIEAWYGGKVLDVFTSTALGPAHSYQCSEADQLRMINGRVSNTSVQLMCGAIGPDGQVSYDWKVHTAAEAGKIHTDYVQFTKDIATQYQTYKARLASATTIEQIEAIFYELWPQG